MKNKELIGKRVRLIFMYDEYSKLVKGDMGTIRFIDDIGTIHVNWDKGSTLGLIPNVDEYEILDNVAKCPNCGYEFDYLSTPESGMGYVKCPKCKEPVTQKDII